MQNPRTEPVVDNAVLASLRELGGEDEPELVEELVELFLADAEGHVASLASASEGGDLQKLERTAHLLKSASANVGAARFAGLCRELERAGHGGDVPFARELATELVEHFREVRSALRSALGKV